MKMYVAKLWIYQFDATRMISARIPHRVALVRSTKEIIFINQIICWPPPATIYFIGWKPIDILIALSLNFWSMSAELRSILLSYPHIYKRDVYMINKLCMTETIMVDAFASSNRNWNWLNVYVICCIIAAREMRVTYTYFVRIFLYKRRCFKIYEMIIICEMCQWVNLRS